MSNIAKNTENEILTAAETEFMTKGYDGAKTTSIAKSAGVTHAMLHYYFRTKENLFNKVFEQKLDIIIQSMLVSFSNTSLSLPERIKCGVENHFDTLVHNPDLPRFVVNELISKPERREMMKQKIGSIAGVVIANLQNEIDAEYKKGTIEKVKAIDLMIDIVSLNVFVFIVYPIIEIFTTELYAGRDQFFAARRKENVEVIMRRLMKNT